MACNDKHPINSWHVSCSTDIHRRQCYCAVCTKIHWQCYSLFPYQTLIRS